MADAYHIPSSRPVASLQVEARSAFVMRTYTHLFGAIIGGFVWDKILKQYIDVDLGSVTIQLHLVLLALLGAGLLILLINFLGKRKV